MLRVLITMATFLFLLDHGTTFAAAKRTAYAYGTMTISPLVETVDPLTLCFFYPSDYYSVSTDPEETFNLHNNTSLDLCDDLKDVKFIASEPNTLFVLWAASKNCTDNLKYIQKGNGSGVVLISNDTFDIDESYAWKVFALLRPGAGLKLEHYHAGDVVAKLYGYARFDASLLVLWAMAVFCVTVGSYTGPYLLFRGKRSSVSSERQILDETPKLDEDSGGNMVGITIPVILGIVVFISTTLMLLYFFYSYLVYFFIGIFCIASARAAHAITMQVLDCCPSRTDIIVWRNIGLKEIIVAVISLSLVIVWVIFRHNYWVWILQDFLGVCFCIHLIQMLNLPNMKVITILLSLLFLYDIFFVFITPYLTKDGKSVMVEVATGGGASSESLPMLLKFPHLSSTLAACIGREFSLLGYGDIIVPGFLVSFAHTFDLRVGAIYPIYLITSVIAYTIGLAGAFVALILSSTGQPALLYIVPVVLGNIFLVGICKKDVNALWRGGPLETPLATEPQTQA